MGRKSKKKKVVPSGTPNTDTGAENKAPVVKRHKCNTCLKCQERFCTVHLRQRWLQLGLTIWRRDHCFQCGGLKMGRTSGCMSDSQFELFFIQLLRLAKEKKLNKPALDFLKHYFERKKKEEEALIKIEADLPEEVKD